MSSSGASQLQGPNMSQGEILHELDEMLTGVVGQIVPHDKPLMQVSEKLRG